MKLKVGDVLEGIVRCNDCCLIRILEIDNDGYLWEYPELPSSEKNKFHSCNSSDPFFERHWEWKLEINKKT